jgi:hypothetical protein
VQAVSKRRAGISLVVVAFLLLGLDLLFTARYVNWTHAKFAEQQAAQQAVQRRAGEVVERAICTDIGTMAAIQPPAGNPARNPSRSYEDAEHRAWTGLYVGLGCRR